MFEITGDDIAALNDEDLRSLIGRLCEAELRRRGLPRSAVTWSGNQTAKDAGLDVRVDLPSGTVIDGFIPRAATGFQVKTPDMPRQAILSEMKPIGSVRPSIAALSEKYGAYILVSSHGSTSDSALNNRRHAMAEAVQDLPRRSDLALDFYDRGRLATWVRDHPGLIPWVRSKIGRSISVWRSYGAWSHRPAKGDCDYLVDDQVRIRSGKSAGADGLPAVEGINRIRDLLRAPGQIARLVGLSGVGKTRLLEALFDDSIGDEALDPSSAIYADVGMGPDPQPAGLLSDLLADGTGAILVLDNCPAELHAQLSAIIRVKGSSVSLISVEYDIQDDRPEGTEVFSLEPSSDALIEKLVARCFPDLSQIDRSTIATFAGGNARVAIAVAGTVEKNETVAGLSDAALFRRLFDQRRGRNEQLLLVAQACALVYSFQGRDLTGERAELPLLGTLIGRSAEEIFRGVAELRQRELVQARGEWCAVLPHAIANRLAAIALQNIPETVLEAVINKSTSPRLLRSFSRRLGWLNDSKEACAIVERWLAPGGLLGDIANLDELGRDMIGYVAPVLPEATLSALECAFEKADSTALERLARFVRLIRSLAYDADLFDRAVALLLCLLDGDVQKHNNTDAASAVISLFHLYLSGTHATIEQRLAAIDLLMRSNRSSVQRLACDVLEAMLETDHFSSSYLFEFGAQSRDFGYHPTTNEDVDRWFTEALSFAEKAALSGLPTAAGVRDAISRKFCGLWTNAECFDDLERIARAIAGRSFWREGWAAARWTRAYSAKSLSPDGIARLEALEEFLRPKDSVSKVRGIVLGSNGRAIDFDEFDDVEDTFDYVSAEKKMAETIERLGRDVASDEKSFDAILPDLIRGGGRTMLFGRALAFGSERPRKMWAAMLEKFAAAPDREPQVMAGFVGGLQQRCPQDADDLLDAAIEDPVLAVWFPYLQALVVIDDKGATRLHRALDLGIAPILRYANLAWGRASDSISGPVFKDLTLAIATRAGGESIAIEMVAMRLLTDSMDKRPTLLDTHEAGREILKRYEFAVTSRSADKEDYELGNVARACLAGPEGVLIVRQIAGRLRNAAARYDVRVHQYDDLLRAFFEVHPEETLDELFVGDGGDEQFVRNGIHLVATMSRLNKNPLAAVTEAILLKWCEHEPIRRYPIIAATAMLFKKANDKAPLEWTPVAAALVQAAPEPGAVISEMLRRLHPSSWRGSLATKLESRSKLLNELDVGGRADLRALIEEAKRQLRKRIDAERERETKEEKQRTERFE